MKNIFFKKSIIVGTLIITFFKISAQEIIPLTSHLPVDGDESTVVEKMSFSDNGSIVAISGVTKPSMTVYLPKPEIATGTAVIILPGGALRFLSWENEGTKVAEWLNSKGIAAFILKYRLDNSEMKMAQSGSMPPMKMQLTVEQFNKIEKANANPSTDPGSVIVANNAGDDAMEAVRVIRKRAKEWSVNPDKIGFLGFSAGGGVALDAVIRNDKEETKADFVGTIYGPSLIDVAVPSEAPPLFIATASDHMNVAAGCLALFTTWKRAGGEAEIHLYGKGKGAFGMTKQNLPSDEWIDSFYTWLKSEGF